MADEQIKIDIRTSADTGGAKEATKDIKAVGGAVDGLGEKLERIKALNSEAGILGGSGDYEGAAKLRAEAESLNEEYLRLAESATGAGEAIGQSSQQAADGANLMSQSQGDARLAADEAAAAIDGTTLAVENLNEAAENSSIKVLANDLEQASVSSEKFSGNIEKVVERSNTKLGRSVRQFNNIKRALDGLVGSSSKTVTALKSVGKAFGIGSIVTIFFKGLGFVKTGLESLNTPTQRLNDNLRLAGSNFSFVVGPIAAATGALSRFITTLNDWANPFEKWSQFNTAISEQAESVRRLGEARNKLIGDAVSNAQAQAKITAGVQAEVDANERLKIKLETIRDIRKEQLDSIGDQEAADKRQEQILEREVELSNQRLSSEFELQKFRIQSSGISEDKQEAKIFKLTSDYIRAQESLNQTVIENEKANLANFVKGVEAIKRSKLREIEALDSPIGKTVKTPKQISALFAEKERLEIDLERSREAARRLLLEEKIAEIQKRRDSFEGIRGVSAEDVELEFLRSGKAADLVKRAGEVPSLEPFLESLVFPKTDFVKKSEVAYKTIRDEYLDAVKGTALTLNKLGFEDIEGLRESIAKLKEELGLIDAEIVKSTQKGEDIKFKEKKEAVTSEDKAKARIEKDRLTKQVELRAERVELGSVTESAFRDALSNIADIEPRKALTSVSLSNSKEDTAKQESADKIVAERLSAAFASIEAQIKDGVQREEIPKIKAGLLALKDSIDLEDKPALKVVETLLTLVRDIKAQYDRIDSELERLKIPDKESGIDGSIEPIVPRELPEGVQRANADAKRELASVAGVIRTGGNEEVEQLQSISGSVTQLSDASSLESEEILRVLSDMISSARSNGNSVASLGGGGGGGGSSSSSSSGGARGTTTGAYSDEYTDSVRSFGSPVTAQSISEASAAQARAIDTVVRAQNQVVAKVNALAKQVKTVA